MSRLWSCETLAAGDAELEASNMKNPDKVARLQDLLAKSGIPAKQLEAIMQEMKGHGSALPRSLDEAETQALPGEPSTPSRPAAASDFVTPIKPSPATPAAGYITPVKNEQHEPISIAARIGELAAELGRLKAGVTVN